MNDIWNGIIYNGTAPVSSEPDYMLGIVVITVVFIVMLGVVVWIRSKLAERK